MASIINAATSGGLVTTADTSGILQLQTASTTAVTVDASQNVGVGVTPSANQYGKNIQVNQTILNDDNIDSNHLAKNAYYNSGWKYYSNGYATKYTQSVGIHSWSTAASGTTGNAITFAQVLAVEGSKSLALQGASPQTGTGITFPATQSASSNANTLDDYEEGTWTPSCAGYNSSPTITYTTLTGTYTKIGRQVTVTFNIVVNTSSGGSGAILIGGLPFTASGRHVASLFSSGINFGTSATQLTGTTIDSAWIYLYGLVNDGASVDTNVGNVAAGDIIRGTLTYFI